METFGRILASGCTSMLVYGVFEWVRGPEKMIKITKYMTFGHFKGIYTSKNLVLNTFSGSTNLWSFLGEYGHLGVLLC